MKRIIKRKCQNCHTFFMPDPRNASRQLFCTKDECRKASKKASQRKCGGWKSLPIGTIFDVPRTPSASSNGEKRIQNTGVGKHPNPRLRYKIP